MSARVMCGPACQVLRWGAYAREDGEGSVDQVQQVGVGAVQPLLERRDRGADGSEPERPRLEVSRPSGIRQS